MEVSSRRFIYTDAWRVKLSRSEMFLSAEVGGCGVTTRSLVLELSAKVLTLAGAFLLGLTVAAFLGVVDLGEGMLALTTRPLGRRGFTPRPGPSARQRAGPA
jgi:hypothetical protein